MTNRYRIEILDEPRDPSKTKICRWCGVEKEHWFFSTDRRNKDGRDCYCRLCRKMKARRRRKRERAALSSIRRACRSLSGVDGCLTHC
jgi:hypothetical protein